MTKTGKVFSLTGLALILFLGWGAGFVSFVERVSTYREPLLNEELEQTDAIVVLTGGRDRVSEGLDLLSAHKGQKLFISGVYPTVKLRELLSHHEIDPATKDCCIELDYKAFNTYDNAKEVQAYMQRQGFRSLRLVTANYHMPRSLLLMGQRMPNTKIIPHPVAPDIVHIRSWWEDTATLSLLAFEYTKYLVALARSFLGV